jgi:hypothetical protein
VLSLFVFKVCFTKLCLYVYQVFQWHKGRLTMRVRTKYVKKLGQILLHMGCFVIVSIWDTKNGWNNL